MDSGDRGHHSQRGKWYAEAGPQPEGVRGGDEDVRRRHRQQWPLWERLGVRIRPIGQMVQLRIGWDRDRTAGGGGGGG